MSKIPKYELPQEYIEADPASQEIQHVAPHPVEMRNVGYEETFKAESERRRADRENARQRQEDVISRGERVEHGTKPLSRREKIGFGLVTALFATGLAVVTPTVVGGHEKRDPQQVVHPNEIPVNSAKVSK